jgi:hypothetical protein
MAHAYNPSYSGGRDQEDLGLKPTQANSLWDPISKIASTKKGWWSDPSGRVPAEQVWGPEFKLQYNHQKKKKNGVGRVNGGDESEWIWLMGLAYIWNRTMKPFPAVLNGMERGLKGRNGGGHLITIQCKAIWNCCSESPLYNEYMLLKK